MAPALLRGNLSLQHSQNVQVFTKVRLQEEALINYYKRIELKKAFSLFLSTDSNLQHNVLQQFFVHRERIKEIFNWVAYLKEDTAK